MKGYDSKCRELAEYFMARPNEGFIVSRVMELSQAIQDAVEDTLSGFITTGEGPYPDEMKGACPSCGCEALDHRGLWVCGCSGMG